MEIQWTYKIYSLALLLTLQVHFKLLPSLRFIMKYSLLSLCSRRRIPFWCL